MLIDTQEIRRLVSEGLVSEKIFSEYPDLRMYKYKNKVFYKNLWNESEMLTECRGLVLDTSGRVVVLPFKKVFNRGENNTNLRDSTVVKRVKKLNGFFAACSMYNKEVLVSTTGSLDSDFTRLAKDKIDLDAAKETLLGIEWSLNLKVTLMFEICHEDDPHIVDEEHGAYLIGARAHGSGLLLPEEVLDRAQAAYNLNAQKKVLRPEHDYCTFKTALRDLKTCQHEGYMVYSKFSGKAVKLKSPHYLSKKFLMRMSNKNVATMFLDPDTYKKTIDEEFYGIVDSIVEDFIPDRWCDLSDQERKCYIENYFGG